MEVCRGWTFVAQAVQTFLHWIGAPERALQRCAQRRPNSLGSTVTSAARGGPQVAIRAAIVPTLRRALGEQPDGHHERVAGALRGLADVTREHVVAERAA